MTHLHPLSPTPDDEITRYFVKLGYKVDWDFSRHEGIEWYEISDDDRDLLQIDMGVSLRALREDMTCWSKGEEGTSDEDYEVHSILWDTPVVNRLLKKVAKTKP